MEREILFRGKRVDNGKWVEGNYSIDVSGRVDILPIDNLVFFEVIPETVGQFTGLTDKNGKKIFEGDIITDDPENLSFKNFYGVKYNEDKASFYVEDENHEEYLGEVWDTDIVVIGNIHDNPELLKEETPSEKYKEFYEKKKAITERLRKDNENF